MSDGKGPVIFKAIAWGIWAICSITVTISLATMEGAGPWVIIAALSFSSATAHMLVMGTEE